MKGFWPVDLRPHLFLLEREGPQPPGGPCDSRVLEKLTQGVGSDWLLVIGLRFKGAKEKRLLFSWSWKEDKISIW